MIKSFKNLLRIITGAVLVLAPLTFPHIVETTHASSNDIVKDYMPMTVIQPTTQTEIKVARAGGICNQDINKEIRFDQLLYSDCDLQIGIRKSVTYPVISVISAINDSQIVLAPNNPNGFNFAHPMMAVTPEPGFYSTGTLLITKMAEFGIAAPTRTKILTYYLFLQDDFNKLNMLRC